MDNVFYYFAKDVVTRDI